MMNYNNITDSSGYFIKTVLTFLVLQSLVILMHEFTHSTVAWLLGTGHSPFGIVWGNPVTMTGWDEGVDYELLFSSGHG